MKKLLLLIILALTAQTINAQAVILDTNGVTIKWTGTTAPSPRWVQASPRGTLEWFAIVDNSTKSNITYYAKNIQSGKTYFTPTGSSTPIPFNNIVTTLVNDMSAIFNEATAFDQPLGAWDVSKVTDMSGMFSRATSFNQPIESWNVSQVTDMHNMFASNSSFDQPLGSWNVANVTDMSWMFGSQLKNTIFNQDIGSWNVNNVANMSGMLFGAKLSAANFDALLAGWANKGINGGVLKQGVSFDGGASNYCNASAARNYLINTYKWVITDGGLNCTGLGTVAFYKNDISLYPNPASSVLNFKANDNLVNQPYAISDSLGKIVLKGKLNEGDTTINVEDLSTGIYYLKVADKNASKFIKE